MAAKPRPDWSVIRLAFIHSTKSLGEVASEYGVTQAAAQQRSHREGWVRLRQSASEIVSAEAARRIEAARAAELAQLAEADTKLVRAIRAQIIGNLNAAAQAAQQLAPLQLRQLAGALAETQKVARLALGATTENTGLSAPNGGPIEGATVPVDEYREAMRDVMREFVAPGSLGE